MRTDSANLPLPRTDVVGNTGTDSNIDQRWWQSDINGVALSNAAGVLPQDLIQQNDVLPQDLMIQNNVSATQTDMSSHTHATAGTFNK
eukprot:scaffold325198_cov49-Attheya_sp.AAC.1